MLAPPITETSGTGARIPDPMIELDSRLGEPFAESAVSEPINRLGSEGENLIVAEQLPLGGILMVAPVEPHVLLIKEKALPDKTALTEVRLVELDPLLIVTGISAKSPVITLGNITEGGLMIKKGETDGSENDKLVTGDL